MAIPNKLILLLFFAVLSFNANSATISDFVTGTFSARNISAIKRSTGRELVANFDFNALSKKTGRPANWPKTVKIGKNGVASLIKRAAFSPWGAVITAAVSAAGYLLDSSTGEITKTVDVQVGGQYCVYSIYGGNPLCYPSLSEAETTWWNAYVQQWGDHYCYDLVQVDSTHWDIVLGCGAGGGNGIYLDNSQGTTTEQQQQPVSDSDLYDAVVPNISDSELKRIFKNSDTGQLDFPGLNEIKNDLKNDIVAANDDDPATNPTVNNSWQLVTGTQDTYYIDNGVSNQLTQITDESKNICETNPTALACIEVGEPDNPSIPESSINFQIDRVQYFGNAQCPSPRTVTVMGQVITLSFDSVCSVAIGVKPIILLFSVFVAMSIVAGTVRSGVID